MPSQPQWEHIEAVMKAGGHITLGRMAPFDDVAVAGDGAQLYAALRRHPDESLDALLLRVDQAIGDAKRTGTLTNELDNGRYVLSPPRTRKKR